MKKVQISPFGKYGFFEEIDINRGISDCWYYDRSKFENVLVYFELPQKKDFKLRFDCGYFDPQDIITYFDLVKSKKVTNETYNVIHIQPEFFVLLLPYPSLYVNLPKDRFKTFMSDNPSPFFKKTVYKKNTVNYLGNGVFKNNRFNNELIESDLKYKISIGTDSVNNLSSINNFMDQHNNCYPIFVEENDQLRILIDDYGKFIKEIFDFEICIKSLSKIIIPFFDIHKFIQLVDPKNYIKL
jgi:hypothetical protein